MGDSNMEAASVKSDIIRLLFSTLDRPAYWLLGLVYQLFFNVASADLFSNGTIMSFYKRIQLIIGVFMMFQLAMTILKGIMNPDSFTDSKNGAANFVKRVAISLVLLTVLVPVNIPGAQNEWERQLNNNGLLFGALYSLQHRILSNNTLGRLILGTDDSAESFTSEESNDKDSSLAKSSRIFTATILKGFYRINLLPEEDRPKHEDGKDDATFNDNRVCKDIDQELLTAYTRLDAEPDEIIGMATATCEYDEAEVKGLWKAVSVFAPKLAGKNRYIFAYMPFVSAVVPFIFVFILLSFTIDVAVRAVKLAVLRLIAPIPIISYMDPKGSKDSSFNSWVKTLTSTYLDLFIRLAVIYFVIYLIQDMIVNGIVINVGSGVLGILSMIIIWIGLFIFAKQAPKFIKQVLGMKDDGGKLFGNLGAALGIGAAAVGAVGSGLASARASRFADENNKGKEAANSLVNRGKHLVAGMAGGVMGLGTGAAAALSAKDHALKNTFDAIQKRNASVISRGSDGSTLLGRMGTNIGRTFKGESAYDSEARDMAQLKAVEAAGKDLHAWLEDRGKKVGAGLQLTHKYKDASGNVKTLSTTFDQFTNQREIAKQQGQSTFTVDGQTFETYGSLANKLEGDLLSQAGLLWAQSADGQNDPTLRQKMGSFVDAGGIDKVKSFAGDNYVAGVTEYDADTIKKVFKKAGGDATEIERSKSYQRHKADHGATGGKK